MGPLEPEPLEKKYQEPVPLGKKSEAGAAKKLAGSSALRYGMASLTSIKVECICIVYKYGQSLLKSNHVKNMKLYASL